jgi:cytochrome c553
MAIVHKTAQVLAVMVLAGAGVALLRSDAGAQTARESAAELRPLYAMGVDIAEGKQLATAVCAKCHGLDGISKTKEVPNLAGQRPSYLYRELKAYQAGDRTNADMIEKVKFLSDDAIVKVAAYYASLDSALAPDTPAPVFVDPVAAGKAAAAPCAKCHEETGISKTAGVPNLIGLSPKYLIDTLKAYQGGEDRKLDAKNEKMKKALDNLTEKDLGHIAIYYALQSENLTRAQTPNEGSPTVTKEQVALCSKCHGEDGVGTSPATPSIAGQDAAYMLKSLEAYKDGSRDDDVMSPRAKKLSDEDKPNLVAYFSSLTPKPTGVAKPLTPVEWAEKCDRCHGANGNSARPNVPALASQRLDYLTKVLKDYQTGVRQSKEMSAMSSVLTDDDINGLAGHYAYQKSKSVVFVTVPSK